MMELFLGHCDGGGYRIYEFISCRMEYGIGVPCDTFYIECPWDSEELLNMERVSTFSATWNGATVFTGILDEFELTMDSQGRKLTLSGRGMLARLLDNQALGMEYQYATLDDILKEHVYPYGITTKGTLSVPGVSGYAVSSGSSEWQALYQFAWYYNGVTPRFDCEGNLVLEPWEDQQGLLIDNKVSISSMSYRNRRYGVLSEVLVRDKRKLVVERVEHTAFQELGGSRRQILTLSGENDAQTMRYSGQFQIEQSQEDWVTMELTLPEAFVAFPGDLVYISRDNCDFNGTYRVRESTVQINGKGQETQLSLGVC